VALLLATAGAVGPATTLRALASGEQQPAQGSDASPPRRSPENALVTDKVWFFFYVLFFSFFANFVIEHMLLVRAHDPNVRSQKDAWEPKSRRKCG
jgi:hypothetical protein